MQITRSIAPITHTDMTYLARLLMTVPSDRKKYLVGAIFDAAYRAANNVPRDVQVFNTCGNGTIFGAVMAHPNRKDMPPEPTFNNVEYLNCWLLALECARTFSIEGVAA